MDPQSAVVKQSATGNVTPTVTSPPRRKNKKNKSARKVLSSSLRRAVDEPSDTRNERPTTRTSNKGRSTHSSERSTNVKPNVEQAGHSQRTDEDIDANTFSKLHHDDSRSEDDQEEHVDSHSAERPCNESDPPSLMEAAECESPQRRPLSEEKAGILATITAQLSEPAILRYMRTLSSRKILLALPIDPGPADCADMLDIMVGMVVHCEAVDASGWALGTVIAPARLEGQRGCFQRQGMHPAVAEVLSGRLGTSLDLLPGTWNMSEHLQTSTTQSRLRQKANQNRMRQARARWDSRGAKG